MRTIQKRTSDLNKHETVVREGGHIVWVADVALYGGHADVTYRSAEFGTFRTIGAPGHMVDVVPRCPHVDGDGPCSICDDPAHRTAMGWDLLDALG